MSTNILDIFNGYYRRVILSLLLALAVVGLAASCRNQEQTLADLRKAAEQGNAEAQFNLGLMYANGIGIPKDGKEAVI